jgi:hypothetical protein
MERPQKSKLDTGRNAVETEPGHNKTVPIGVEMAIDTLSPGAYVMKIEVANAQEAGLAWLVKDFGVE